MDTALGWLGDLARWLAAWIPRLEICRATHGGVKFVRGKNVREVRPGLYVYWPAVTEVVLLPTVCHPVNLPPQSLTTRDGKTVLVSVTLVVEVADVVKALAKTWDVDQMIADVAGAATMEVVSERTWKELRQDDAVEDLVRAARRLLRPYGVRVVKGRFTDCARHTVIRTIGRETVVPAPEEDVE